MWEHVLLIVAAALTWACVLPGTREPTLAAAAWLCSAITRLGRQAYPLALALTRLVASMAAERSRRRLAAAARASPSTAVRVSIASDCQPCQCVSLRSWDDPYLHLQLQLKRQQNSHSIVGQALRAGQAIF